jgi:hypothetical protein
MPALPNLAAALAAAIPFLAAVSPPPSKAADSLRVDGPYTHQNLSIYVVSGASQDARRFVTLAEGLKNKTVRLREKGGGASASVNELEIENASDRWLYLQAGDVIVGGQQDRTIGIDVAIPPHSKPRPIAAFCVEHGRWTPRAASGSSAYAFGDSTAIAGSNAMKVSIQDQADQVKVWAEVAREEKRAAEKLAPSAGAGQTAAGYFSSTGTYAGIVANPTIGADRAAYVDALLPAIEKSRDALGIVVAIDGKIQAADVYGSTALFQALARKLLDSYAQQASLSSVAASTPPTAQEASSFLRSSTAGPSEKSEKVAPATTRTTIRSRSRTDQTVVFEYTSEDGSAASQKTLLHRNYIRN